MKRLNLIISIVLVCLCSAASAQQERGDVELSISGLYLKSVGSDFGFSSGTVNGKIGFFVTDNFEIGVFPSLTISSTTTTRPRFDSRGRIIGEEKETTTETTFGSGSFMTVSLLANAKTVPYFGGQFYIPDFDNTDVSYAGVYAGSKFFLTEKAFFELSGNYLFAISEATEGGLLLFSAGFGFLF